MGDNTTKHELIKIKIFFKERDFFVVDNYGDL